MQEEQIQEKNKNHPVIVYSKSWCPYCGEVGVSNGCKNCCQRPWLARLVSWLSIKFG